MSRVNLDLLTAVSLAILVFGMATFHWGTIILGVILCTISLIWETK